ncbi:MAG: glutamyl-tRNA reductase [Gammaproteobacteria bacterium]
MTLLAFGINHATAPIEIRERVSFGADILSDALSELTTMGGVDEAAILSTCNRTEVYCSLDGQENQRPINWFSNYHGMKQDQLQPFLYTHPDANAVKHVFRVACGLDSMVLGEPQVLGQLKTAYQIAVDAGCVGQLLSHLFQHSFMVAKEVRSSTEIGNHPVSIAFAAVRLAQQIFGDLANQTALLIGAGETIELAAKHLHENNLGRMIIANRTVDRSQHLAKEFSAYAIALVDISKHLAEADIVISSTASPLPILGKGAVESAIKARKHRPIFMVDIAVPRDIEPEVGDLDDIYLYTVDDLKEVIEANMRSRRQAALQAEEIIDTQVTHFMDWLSSLDAVSTIRALREHAEQLQKEVIQSAISKLKRGGDPEQILQETGRTLSNKLLHSPSTQLRNASAEGRSDLLQAVQELYNLKTGSGK